MFTPKGRYHIFDGDGMLHGITLDGEGCARYRNRWVRTEGLAAEQRVGHAIYGGMANGDFPTPEETAGGPSMKNVANTNVIRHAGRILCLWEAGLPTEVTPALETVGPFDFGGALDRPFTAHPKLDPSTGRMYAFGYSPVPPYLSLYVVDADGTLARTIDIDLPAPVMMHDFAVTERHAVFLDAPAVFDLDSFMHGGPMLSWKPELGTRFGVLPLDGDERGRHVGRNRPVLRVPLHERVDLGRRHARHRRRLPAPEDGHRPRKRGRTGQGRFVAAPVHDRPRGRLQRVRTDRGTPR